MGVRANDFQYANDEQAYIDQQISGHNLDNESHPILLERLQELLSALDGFVLKEAGKGLSENDYTDEEKDRLASVLSSINQLSSALSALQNEVSDSVKQVPGKGLSENDFTALDKQNLQNAYRIAENAYTLLSAHANNKALHVPDSGVVSMQEYSADRSVLGSHIGNIDSAISSLETAINGLQAHLVNTDVRLIEVENNMGDIDSALDSIIAMQEELTGGAAS